MRSGTHRRLIAWRMFALGMASLALGQHAQAATKSWIGGNANWSVGGNWTGGSVPVAGDAVILNQSGSVTSTQARAERRGVFLMTGTRPSAARSRRDRRGGEAGATLMIARRGPQTEDGGGTLAS